jgi:hypothetical protein
MRTALTNEDVNATCTSRDRKQDSRLNDETDLPGRVARIAWGDGESAEDGWRTSRRCPERSGGAAVGRKEEGAAGISYADAVEPRCPTGSFSCRGDDTGRAVRRGLEMAENVVVRQGEQRGRQDVRRE